MIEMHPDTPVTHRLLHLTLPQDRGHVVQVDVAAESLGVLAIDLVRLLETLLVRICVLLQALDAVLDLWPAETCKQRAGLNYADVHHRAVETLRSYSQR